jgi:hypothetical protein
MSAGNDDIFVSKLDKDGNFVWARAMGGSGDDIGRDIALDFDRNVYTTGRFQNTADFDPGLGGIFDLMSAGNDDIFVSKLDSSGGFVWAKAMGGSDNDLGFGIALGAGSVHTTGRFQGTADFDPGPGIFNLMSTGGDDIFVHKLAN